MRFRRGYRPKTVARMNDSRKLPWLAGLLAAVVIAVVLFAVAVEGTLQVINDFGIQIDDTTFQP